MKNGKPSILIVDDERGTREAMAKYLRLEYDVTLAEDGEAGINLINSGSYELILSDIRMEPGPSGLDVLNAALKHQPPIPCILFTAYGSIETAVEAVKRGAFDFVTKPVNFDRLEVIIQRALESGRLRQENRELKQRLNEKLNSKGMIGSSPEMKRIQETIEQVAPTRATVLITGESGTGKELVAQALHQASGRTGKFVAVHCAALPETLLESELFGHERGAFTGAVEMRKGRFELAENGTIFLDEIGEIPLHIQVKLLRVLENRSFERIGGTETITSNARVIAATNRDLRSMVSKGEFREDLFYRLDVVSIHLPPLRERKGDIPLLVKHYLDLYANENGKKMEITEKAMNALCAFEWPGNIRELRNCMERLVVLTRGNEIDLNNIPAEILNGREAGTKVLPASSVCDLECNEKMLIQRALNECGGNRTKAAERLGISRRTLHRKLNAYQLE